MQSQEEEETTTHKTNRIIRVDFTGWGRPLPKRRPSKEKGSETGQVFIPTLGMDFPEWCLHGLAGAIVKKLMPETETHPAAVLFHILARFGSVIGRSAYTQTEGTRHYANLFAVIVGKTAKSRKGTANDRAEEIFKGIDGTWEANCQFGGFGSGEGVIHIVRDDRTDKKGNLIPGVSDKRLFIREGEFGNILAVAKRDGNRLSQVIRDAWDGKPLRNSVKNDPEVATDAHVSAICDITIHEINLTMNEADRFNGFANRFVWVFVERTKEKYFGGATLDWSKEQRLLRAAVAFAKKQKRVFMTEAARQMWRRNYSELSSDREGIVGGVTSRAEAQVLRLALLFALFDSKRQIWSCHLQAALALWRYCLRSAQHIFGESGLITAEQTKMLDEVKQGPRSKTDFYLLFKHHRPAALIAADLRALEDKNLIEEIEDGDGVAVWILKGGS